MSHTPAALSVKEDDIRQFLACQTHLGTKGLEFKMGSYVWKRNTNGVHILNLGKTWEKLVLAARVIVAIENPAEVCVISARPYGQRAVLKFASFTGAQALAGRFTPGTFTNQIQKNFIEPRLLVVNDPRTDHQAIREASYVNIPVIAFANSDSPLRFVDVAIPCNNKGRQSVGLMWWMLCREVLRLRGTIRRDAPWDVMVDMFIYRDPEEEREEQAAAAAAAAAAAPAREEAKTEEWTEGTYEGGQQWGDVSEQQWSQPAATV